MNKEDTVKLLYKKLNGKVEYSYKQLSILTGYSIRHLKRLAKSIEEKGTELTLSHGNTGSAANNRASDKEINYIVNFKKLYPEITIAQFRDFYLEDIIYNPDKSDDILKYGLKERSHSFFKRLYKLKGWESPVKHRKFKSSKDIHTIREKSPREGLLIQIDGTPYDWLGNGEMYCLHLAVDDATIEVLAGWFTPHECLYGYIKMFELLLKKKGIPLSVYSDNHKIFKGKDDNLTKFGEVMDRLGIEMIYAGSPQAKGRIERYNGTTQLRLPNDIKRHKIKDYDKLNTWFNDYYINYLNNKFSLLPKDPISEYVPLNKEYNLNEIFVHIEERRILEGNVFSYNGYIYMPIDKNGKIIKIRNTTKIKVYLNLLTGEIQIKYFNKLCDCKVIGQRGNKQEQTMENQKDLIQYIKKLSTKNKE